MSINEHVEDVKTAHAKDAEIDLVKDINMAHAENLNKDGNMAHAGDAQMGLIKNADMNVDTDTDMAFTKEAAQPFCMKKKKKKPAHNPLIVKKKEKAATDFKMADVNIAKHVVNEGDEMPDINPFKKYNVKVAKTVMMTVEGSIKMANATFIKPVVKPVVKEDVKMPDVNRFEKHKVNVPKMVMMTAEESIKMANELSLVNNVKMAHREDVVNHVAEDEDMTLVNDIDTEKDVDMTAVKDVDTEKGVDMTVVMDVFPRKDDKIFEEMMKEWTLDTTIVDTEKDVGMTVAKDINTETDVDMTVVKDINNQKDVEIAVVEDVDMTVVNNFSFSKDDKDFEEMMKEMTIDTPISRVKIEKLNLKKVVFKKFKIKNARQLQQETPPEGGRENAYYSLMKDREGHSIDDLHLGLEYWTQDLHSQRISLRRQEVDFIGLVKDMTVKASTLGYEDFVMLHDKVDTAKDALKEKLNIYIGSAKLLEVNLCVCGELPYGVWRAKDTIEGDLYLKSQLLETDAWAFQEMNAAMAVAEAKASKEKEASISVEDVEEMVAQALTGDGSDLEAWNDKLDRDLEEYNGEVELPVAEKVPEEEDCDFKAALTAVFEMSDEEWNQVIEIGNHTVTADPQVMRYDHHNFGPNHLKRDRTALGDDETANPPLKKQKLTTAPVIVNPISTMRKRAEHARNYAAVQAVHNVFSSLESLWQIILNGKSVDSQVPMKPATTSAELIPTITLVNPQKHSDNDDDAPAKKRELVASSAELVPTAVNPHKCSHDNNDALVKEREPVTSSAELDPIVVNLRKRSHDDDDAPSKKRKLVASSAQLVPTAANPRKRSRDDDLAPVKKQKPVASGPELVPTLIDDIIKNHPHVLSSCNPGPTTHKYKRNSQDTTKAKILRDIVKAFGEGVAAKDKMEELKKMEKMGAVGLVTIKAPGTSLAKRVGHTQVIAMYVGGIRKTIKV